MQAARSARAVQNARSEAKRAVGAAAVGKIGYREESDDDASSAGI